MGGKNPYLQPTEFELPQTGYRITFKDGDHQTGVDVDPKKIPYGRDGLPGSILDIALANGVSVDHACGGVLACSTCHVIVRKGSESCNAATDAENDMLDLARGLTPQSRLACQCVPNGSVVELVVEIPQWNRNLAREEHH